MFPREVSTVGFEYLVYASVLTHNILDLGKVVSGNALLSKITSRVVLKVNFNLWDSVLY